MNIQNPSPSAATHSTRRSFLQATGAALAAPLLVSATAGETRKIKVGLIGCGSVSRMYLPHLAASPWVELVSVCDIIPERAQQQADRFKVPHQYASLDQMLAGASFELLVNTTDMQEHGRLNRQAIMAGKNIWSEKPMATTVADAQELLDLAKTKGVRLWGAPTVVNSPAFQFMAKTLAAGGLGRVAAAHAHYGHEGPNWAAFFYQKNGGSLPDLGVYNLTTLTGLLGPAKSVVAMTSIVTPTREITGRGTVEVTEEDNAMILLDHGQGVISHIQCGFNYFNPHGHEGRNEQRHTLSIVGTQGAMGLVGYDWEPGGVELATPQNPEFKRFAIEQNGYRWEEGASVAAECLATGREPLFTAGHAVHVCEIMIAARESQASGRRIPLQTTFQWPVVS